MFKKPLFIASLLAAAAINAGMFGFYSFLSDYLGSAGFAAAAVSALLFAYGVANISGNAVAGRALGAVPARTMVVAPIVLLALYVLLFALGAWQLACAALLIVLGVAVGVANTTDQYMVGRSAPEAPDFANGMFLTATNLGTTVGTTLCGGFIAAGGAPASVLGALPCAALGLIFVAWRLREQRRGDLDGRTAAVPEADPAGASAR